MSSFGRSCRFRNLLYTRNVLHYSYTNSNASVPAGNPQIWLFFALVSKRFDHQSSNTDISPDDEKVSDEVVNQIIVTRENRDTFDACIDKMCRSGNLAAAALLLKSLCVRKIFLSSTKAYDMVLLAASEN